MRKLFLILPIVALSIFVFFKAYENKPPVSTVFPAITTFTNTITATPTPTPTPALQLIPITKTIENNYHVFQTFNNCGPAALSMALSYYGINISQQELGQDLRPYQNPQGNNDDKSVTLDELAEKARKYNLVPFHRPNGSIELVKQFLAYDIPIITRTLLKEDDDIGHYRVIKGYDDTTREFIQDDSLQGHNLRYSYSLFTSLWQTFDYEFLVLIPPDKKQIAKTILGENADEATAWKNAVESSRNELVLNPDNIYSKFNLSVALYHAGDFQSAVSEFEMVEDRLPFRTLWYQIEPIRAYYELGDYQRVFDITNNIFNNQNMAFSELYMIRGEIYKKQGKIETARNEFEKAVFYNQNLKSAQQLLLSAQ
jgi:tetratricopeptide (TPR) repeat protein